MKETKIDMLREIAIELVDIGQYSAAQKCYDTALSLEPDNPVLKRLSASNLLRLEKYAQAMTLLEQCISSYTEPHLIWMDMGLINEIQANKLCTGYPFVIPPFILDRLKVHYKHAIECYENAFKCNPKSWGILQKIERYYAFIGNYEKAIEYREKSNNLKKQQQS